MYTPKRHVRLATLSSPPNIGDLKDLLGQADKAKGCTVELPWRSPQGKLTFSLTVRAELAGGEPIWTLYEGEGADSQIMWSSPFEDLALLNDVLSLSLPSQAGPGELKTPSANNNGSNSHPAVADHAQQMPSKAPAPYSQQQLVPPSSAPNPQPGPATSLPPAQMAYPYPPMLPPGYYPSGYLGPPYQQTFPPGYPYPLPYAQGYVPAPPAQPGPDGQPVYPPNYYPGFAYLPGYLPYPYFGPPTNPAPDSISTAASVPIKPGPPPSPAPELAPLPAIKPDPDLLKKASNILLGHFLVESALIPERTLQAALRLQELVKRGFLSTAQAAEAVKRSHLRGGEGDPDWDNLKLGKAELALDAAGPPLGQILVDAGLISSIVLKAALKLQEVVRAGVMSKEEACKALYSEYFGTPGQGVSQDSDDDPPQVNRAIRLMIKAGMINDQDVIRAKNVRQRHGGKVSKILIATGKVDEKTFAAAIECENLISAERIKLEKAMIALHYCQRSRVSLRDAIKELGWGQV